ncbi:Bardet-Biedl syndrome 2 protein like protein [Aduncisulcus paluster]|uniref:Bardet-Biedl syndrome 2 protein like protein n=1 Tax=Aduncisulcus paluster TaxID=2918883 RepID=A0ABQ5K533_9EUKA|nr:Bardet-Biedl syndrome 2 protein like protein [Aduncisulcus paluster]
MSIPRINSSFFFRFDDSTSHATVGKFISNGSISLSGIAYVATGGKVIVHSPKAPPELAQLEIPTDRHVLAICAIPKSFDQDEDSSSEDSSDMEESSTKKHSPNQDLLLIATENSVRAYNVSDRCDVFTIDIPDGISTIFTPSIEDISTVSDPQSFPSFFIGGNCSVQGFSNSGEQLTWSVTSDTVTALTVGYWMHHESPLVIAAASDGTLRAFSGPSIKVEVLLSSPARYLCPVTIKDLESHSDDSLMHCVGFSLTSGVFGVHSGDKQVWSREEGRQISSLCSVDIKVGLQTLCALAVGYVDGNVSFYSSIDGTPLFTSKLPSSPVFMRVTVLDSPDSTTSKESEDQIPSNLPSEPQLICVCDGGYVCGLRPRPLSAVEGGGYVLSDDSQAKWGSEGKSDSKRRKGAWSGDEEKEEDDLLPRASHQPLVPPSLLHSLSSLRSTALQLESEIRSANVSIVKVKETLKETVKKGGKEEEAIQFAANQARQSGVHGVSVSIGSAYGLHIDEFIRDRVTVESFGIPSVEGVVVKVSVRDEKNTGVCVVGASVYSSTVSFTQPDVCNSDLTSALYSISSPGGGSEVMSGLLSRQHKTIVSFSRQQESSDSFEAMDTSDMLTTSGSGVSSFSTSALKLPSIDLKGLFSSDPALLHSLTLACGESIQDKNDIAPSLTPSMGAKHLLLDGEEEKDALDDKEEENHYSDYSWGGEKLTSDRPTSVTFGGHSYRLTPSLADSSSRSCLSVVQGGEKTVRGDRRGDCVFFVIFPSLSSTPLDEKSTITHTDVDLTLLLGETEMDSHPLSVRTTLSIPLLPYLVPIKVDSPTAPASATTAKLSYPLPSSFLHMTGHALGSRFIAMIQKHSIETLSHSFTTLYEEKQQKKFSVDSIDDDVIRVIFYDSLHPSQRPSASISEISSKNRLCVVDIAHSSLSIFSDNLHTIQFISSLVKSRKDVDGVIEGKLNLGSKISKNITSILSNARELSVTRKRLHVEAAEQMIAVKAAVIALENARLLEYPSEMTQALHQLEMANGMLVATHNKRTANQRELKGFLQQVNWLLQLITAVREHDAIQACVLKARKSFNKGDDKAFLDALRYGR